MNKSKEFLLKNIIFSTKVLNKNSKLEHVINKSVFTFFEHKKDTDLEESLQNPTLIIIII